MFAVKGWSVDAASLKPQTEVFSANKSHNGELSKSSKKRKRGQVKEAHKTSDVQQHDVEQLWKTHVEDGRRPNGEKRVAKNRRLENNANRSTSADAPRLTRKQRKTEPREENLSNTVEQRQDEVTRQGSNRKKRRKKEEAHFSTAELRGSDMHVDGSVQETQSNAAREVLPIPQPSSLTPMQSAMRQKLVSARFRHLNQTLYTEPSSKAKDLFEQNPEMFQDYHTGFRQQVSVWPANPLDKFIKSIRERGKIKAFNQSRAFKAFKKRTDSKPAERLADPSHALPRTNGICVIADLGCGDARLAHNLIASGDASALNLKILSYDLHSTSKHVEKADISNLSLRDDSVNVAILCLALMGTNWITFIEEAYRVLHWKGELWIAEIKSRFGRLSRLGKPVDHSVGGKRKQPPSKAAEARAREEEEIDQQTVLQVEVDGIPTTRYETDVSAFVQVLKRRGFTLKPPAENNVDLSNKMFVKMEFVKALPPTKGKGKTAADVKGDVSQQKLNFLPEEGEDMDTDDETRVLKPCLYKLR